MIIYNIISIYFSLFFSDLDHRLSILIWLAILVSFIVCITVPRLSGIRTLAGAVILRMIFTLGIKPTLTILGLLNVSFSTDTVYLFILLMDFLNFITKLLAQTPFYSVYSVG